MTLPSSIGGPTTQQVGFFAHEHSSLATWLNDSLDGTWQTSRASWRSAADASHALTPAAVVSRYGCIALNGWSLVLNNSPLGTDVGLLPSRAARDLKCRAIRAVSINDGQPRDPAQILDVYGPEGDLPGALLRSVAALKDGGRWVFETAGKPFDFEDQSAYRNRIKARRFTKQMLTEYLRALGVPVDSEPEWMGAVLVERVSNAAKLRR